MFEFHPYTSLFPPLLMAAEPRLAEGSLVQGVTRAASWEVSLPQSTTASPLAPTGVPPAEKSPAYARRRHEVVRPAGSEPLSRLQVPEERELAPELAKLWGEFAASYGFVPNWLRALSINPDTDDPSGAVLPSSLRSGAQSPQRSRA